MQGMVLLPGEELLQQLPCVAASTLNCISGARAVRLLGWFMWKKDVPEWPISYNLAAFQAH